MKFSLPDWLIRLREWLTEKKSELQENVSATVCYALLASIFLGLAEAFSHTIWLVGPGVFFVVLAICVGIYCIFLICLIVVAQLAHNVTKAGYLSGKLLLTLLKKIYGFTLRILSRLVASRLFTPIVQLVVLVTHDLWTTDIKDIEMKNMLYVLIGSGIAKEAIDALVHHVIAKRKSKRK